MVGKMTGRKLKSLVLFAAAPVAIVAGAMALGGCSELRQAIGAEKSSPDEFQIRVRKPLSMPREYGLRAPRPGATRPQDGRSRARARQIVLDSDKSRRGARRVLARIKGVSRQEATLIAKLGGGSVDTGIRLKVDRETAQIAEDKKSFVDAILFWKDQAEPGKVVDPKSEARRIQENAALGRRGNAGNVPTIERKKKGLFSQSIFADLF